MGDGRSHGIPRVANVVSIRSKLVAGSAEQRTARRGDRCQGDTIFSGLGGHPASRSRLVRDSLRGSSGGLFAGTGAAEGAPRAIAAAPPPICCTARLVRLRPLPPGGSKPTPVARAGSPQAPAGGIPAHYAVESCCTRCTDARAAPALRPAFQRSLPVERCISQLAVERLRMAILPWASRLDEGRRHPQGLQPLPQQMGCQFGTVVAECVFDHYAVPVVERHHAIVQDVHGGHRDLLQVELGEARRAAGVDHRLHVDLVDALGRPHRVRCSGSA